MTRAGRGQRGSALVAALALFAIALGLVTLVTARAMAGAQAMVRRERQALALNAAEAGLAATVERLRLDPFMAETEGECGTPWSAELSHDFSAPDAHVAVVTVTASAADQARRVRARLLVVTSPDLAAPATVSLLSWELLPGA